MHADLPAGRRQRPPAVGQEEEEEEWGSEGWEGAGGAV